jgi:DNA-binding winged helix-turn-helix (wHTH) protein
MAMSERRLYEFGDFHLDACERLLSRRGVTVPLTPKSIDLLLALVEQPGRLLDKDTLLKTVWPDTFVEENNLADNIFMLRRVLGDGENGPRFIETVPKRGYRFVADLRVVGPLTEPGPDVVQQGVAVPPPQAKGRDGQVPLPATNVRRPMSVASLVAGAIALLVLALGVGYGRRGTPEPPRMVKASLLPPENTSFGDIALSPDGRWLAFTAATGSHVQLWLLPSQVTKRIPWRAQTARRSPSGHRTAVLSGSSPAAN